TPNSGVQGASVPVTIAGSNLTGATLNLPAGITLAAAPTVTATSITATLVIAPTATPGAQSITASSPAGTTNAVTFTVVPTPPALTSITPATRAHGTSEPLI